MDGSRVLVVGGSAGLGRAFGVHAARAGASVVFSARRREALEEAAALAGGFAVPLDVTDGPSVEHGVAEAVEHLGGTIDVLVYASGWAQLAPLEAHDAHTWERMFATNVIGATRVVNAARHALAPEAVLVFFTSTSTHRRLWALNGYGATKAALDRYLEGLKDEQPALRITRLRIGSTIGTEFGNEFDAGVLTEAFGQWIASGNHTEALMAPDDVASVALGVVSLLQRHPGVDIPDLQLDPPGGMARP